MAGLYCNMLLSLGWCCFLLLLISGRCIKNKPKAKIRCLNLSPPSCFPTQSSSVYAGDGFQEPIKIHGYSSSFYKNTAASLYPQVSLAQVRKTILEPFSVLHWLFLLLLLNCEHIFKAVFNSYSYFLILCSSENSFILWFQQAFILKLWSCYTTSCLTDFLLWFSIF